MKQLIFGMMYSNHLVCTDQPFTESEVLPSLVTHSKHQLIHSNLSLSISCPPPYKRKVWDYKPSNVDAIRRKMSSISWNDLFFNLNVNEMSIMFTDTFINLNVNEMSILFTDTFFNLNVNEMSILFTDTFFNLNVNEMSMLFTDTFFNLNVNEMSYTVY